MFVSTMSSKGPSKSVDAATRPSSEVVKSPKIWAYFGTIS